jgi:hypothetical protein
MVVLSVLNVTGGDFGRPRIEMLDDDNLMPPGNGAIVIGKRADCESAKRVKLSASDSVRVYGAELDDAEWHSAAVLKLNLA